MIRFSDWRIVNLPISGYIAYIHKTVAQDGTDRVALDMKSSRT
jgi:hypothetical protein